jgi:hypothetical protein
VGRVIIEIDPGKLAATIEVLDDRERVVAQARFGTAVTTGRSSLRPAAGRNGPPGLPQPAEATDIAVGCWALGRP